MVLCVEWETHIDLNITYNMSIYTYNPKFCYYVLLSKLFRMTNNSKNDAGYSTMKNNCMR